MIKNIHKKILIISLLVTIFLIIISNNNQCFALSDVTNDIWWTSWEPTIQDDSELVDKTGTILGIIRTIGIVVSVGTLAFIGIKFMWGSVEEKANYKQTLIPWIIGATMVFTITTIPTIIYDMTNGALTDGNLQNNSEYNYIKGYDDALKYVEENKAIPHIKEVQLAIEANSDYGLGYTDALNNIKDLSLKRAYAICSNEIASEIENGTITESNIAEKYNNELNTWNNAGELDKEKYQAKLDRLLLQIEYWGVRTSLAEYATWRKYAKGYDAAAEYAQTLTQGYITTALDKIKTRKDEINKYGSAYWIGYVDCLKQIYDNCEKGTNVKYYVKGHSEILSLIDPKDGMGMTTLPDIIYPSNIDKKITELNNMIRYYKEGKRDSSYYEGIEYELMAKTKRLEIQKHIWNGDEYVINLSR